MAESSRAVRRRKGVPSRNPILPQETSEFDRIHFTTTPLAKRFESHFMRRKVIDVYYVDLEDFRGLIVCGRSVRDMLLPWESTLDFDERVYPNLVRVFYSNMEIYVERMGQIITHVRGVPIEFDVKDLNNTLGTPDTSRKIYTARKALSFADFFHPDGVRNICRC